jgi:hypothetical protein
MIGGAISTTHRRSIHPAVQFISLEAQPAALSRALPIPDLLGILSTPRHRICVPGVAGPPATESRQWLARLARVVISYSVGMSRRFAWASNPPRSGSGKRSV